MKAWAIKFQDGDEYEAFADTPDHAWEEWLAGRGQSQEHFEHKGYRCAQVLINEVQPRMSESDLEAPTLIDVVVRHEQQIQELKRLVTPMMEFKQEMPTKICGPNLVGILNAAGFYQKKEWVGLTLGEKAYSNTDYAGKCAEAWQGGVDWAEDKLKDKNT